MQKAKENSGKPCQNHIESLQTPRIQRPWQAIDVLDETGARVRLRESSIVPDEAKEAQQKLKEAMGSKARASKALENA